MTKKQSPKKPAKAKVPVMEIPLAGMNTTSQAPPVVQPPATEEPTMTNHIHDDDEPKVSTVTVKSLKYHTHQGEAHQEGDSYQVDADQVDNLVAQGMAAPVEDK